MNYLQSILNIEHFWELPDKLEAFLAQADLTQSSMTQLYKALEQSCSQSLMDAFLSGHPKWCIFSKSKAAHVFLYRKWEKSRSLKENRERLKSIANEIRNEYIPSDGPHISPDSVENVLRFLDKNYTFFNIIFSGRPLLILLPDCGHRVYDAFCRPYTFTDGSNSCDIFMFHAIKDTKTSPECTLLHELGHVLNVSRTGDIAILPDSFQKFNELLLRPEDCRAVMQEATEMYANVFAIAVLTAKDLKEFDRYGFIPDEVRSWMKKYIQYELSLCGSRQLEYMENITY